MVTRRGALHLLGAAAVGGGGYAAFDRGYVSVDLSAGQQPATEASQPRETESPTQTQDPDAEAFDAEAVEAKLAELTNSYRQQEGKPTLQRDQNLTEAARNWAERMATEDFLAHERDGSTPAKRALAAGANCDKIAENVAYSWWRRQIDSDDGSVFYSTNVELAGGLMRQWRNSPEHNTNMLLADVDQIGVGVAANGSKVFAVQDFCG